MIKKLIGIIFAVLCIASACALDAGAGAAKIRKGRRQAHRRQTREQQG